MNDYMLLLFDDPSTDANISPADMQSIIAEYHAWGQKLDARDLKVDSNKLCAEGGRRIQGAAGSPSVTDGPFSETKEVLGGYYVIRAETYDDAVELCRDHPHLKYGLRMELRQVEDLGE